MPLPFFGGAKKTKITSGMSIALTEQGKRTAEQQLSRGPTFAILSVLQDHSPRSVGEIAEETDIDISEVKQRVKDLAKGGSVRILNEFVP